MFVFMFSFIIFELYSIVTNYISIFRVRFFNSYFDVLIFLHIVTNLTFQFFFNIFHPILYLHQLYFILSFTSFHFILLFPINFLSFFHFFFLPFFYPFNIFFFNRILYRYRPLAPSVLNEHAADWFDDMLIAENVSPYMSITTKIKDDKCSLIPAVCHIDQTARLQTVKKEKDRKSVV